MVFVIPSLCEILGFLMIQFTALNPKRSICSDLIGRSSAQHYHDNTVKAYRIIEMNTAIIVLPVKHFNTTCLFANNLSHLLSKGLAFVMPTIASNRIVAYATILFFQLKGSKF
jgi:hypothetical protein